MRRRLRDVSATLRASALLALCKLMCLDAVFCDTNLQLVFTLLQNRCKSLLHLYMNRPSVDAVLCRHISAFAAWYWLSGICSQKSAASSTAALLIFSK